jgi:hypothetical protein
MLQLRVIVGCAFVAAVLLSTGIARSVATSGSSPVTLKHCEVVPGRTMVTGGGGRFVPGFFPRSGPYVWRDPFGRMYRQWPTPARVSTTDPALYVDYVNSASDPLEVVVIGLVTNGNLIAEVRDVGSFTQGATISRSFGLNPVILPLTGLPQCVPLQAKFKNGTVWTHPHLPALSPRLYAN